MRKIVFGTRLPQAVHGAVQVLHGPGEVCFYLFSRSPCQGQAEMGSTQAQLVKTNVHKPFVVLGNLDCLLCPFPHFPASLVKPLRRFRILDEPIQAGAVLW
jgi:hypothetical protein